MSQVSRYFIPLCNFCRHFNLESLENLGQPLKCKAFPDGLPIEIWANNFDHRTPHLNDGGIQFEKFTDREILAPFLAKKDDDSVQKLLQKTLEGLENNRKAGATFPPIAENEEALLALLKASYPYTDEELNPVESLYIPRELLDWLIERTQQSLAEKRKQDSNTSNG